MRDRKGTWIPDIRIQFGPSFPTGKYQKLNPKKGGSDIGGSGAYEITSLLILQKIFYSIPRHPFNINLNFYYIVLTKTHVKGLNAYGGVITTKGIVNPGNQFIVNLASEFSITQNWVIGWDLQYKHIDKSSFEGHREITATQEGLPSSEEFSFAPSIEYCFCNTLSLSWGIWFTMLGRNTSAFMSNVFNVYYVF